MRALLVFCLAVASAQQPGALTWSAPVEHLAALAREPMLVEHPNGSLFVTGYGSRTPRLWRSADAGATWTDVPLGSEADGAVGNSDVDLAVAPDGTLYMTAMTYDRAKSEGTRIGIGVSRDAGKTWTWTELSKTRFDDRPWVKVAPDGTAHAIWNDGAGVSYSRSRDAGRTWQEQPRIHPQGGSSHLAVGPAGELAVRITPVSASGLTQHKDVDLVAVSRDGGTTWTKHRPPGTRAWMFPMGPNDPLPRWVEPLAWDAAGHLYSLWSEPSALWLARSTDRGATWTTWKIAEGGAIRFFPYLTARGAGELAAAWFSGTETAFDVRVARIDVPKDGQPRVTLAPPIVPDTWRFEEKPGQPRLRDPAGEYVPVAILRSGRLAVVTTIQNDQQKRLGFSFRTAQRK